MKTFKTLLVTLIVFTSFCLPIRAYASPLEDSTDEVITTNEEEPYVFTINGMDATVRDTESLNLRQSPSTNSKILATISAGEHFTIVDQTGKWFSVVYNDISGYVFWKYVSFTEEEPSEDSNLLGHSIIHYTSKDNRDTNISIACNTINGIVLQPGETFTWSKIVGKATKEKGYLPAPVIVNKKVKTGLGGGICQVSSTLYNAILDTSIVPDEVYNHSIGSSYTKNDATVAYGYMDFVFTNSYDFPIKIEAYSYKAVISIKLYKEPVTEN